MYEPIKFHLRSRELIRLYTRLVRIIYTHRFHVYGGVKAGLENLSLAVARPGILTADVF